MKEKNKEVKRIVKDRARIYERAKRIEKVKVIIIIFF